MQLTKEHVVAAGKTITLKAADGHALGAWLATPAGTPRAGLVVIQEIFGVNGHMRHVTEAFARHGYLAVAPALFDRVRPGIELGYDAIEAGRDVMMKLDQGQLVLDLAAAIDAVRPAGRVGIVGYCWGGSVADLAACRTDVDAAVSLYGRQMVGWLDEKPRCPIQYHFGRLDPLIPMDVVEQVRAGRPGQEFFVYDEAGHGFCCDERPEFHRPSAELAERRTLAFFERHLGAGAARGPGKGPGPG